MTDSSVQSMVISRGKINIGGCNMTVKSMGSFMRVEKDADTVAASGIFSATMTRLRRINHLNRQGGGLVLTDPG